MFEESPVAQPTPATATTSLRRQPVQQRSAKRVERMLEACAALIDELGYDGVTTTLIADRVVELLASRFQLSTDELRLPVSVAVAMVDGILNLCYREELFPEDVVVGEAKRVVRGYLSGKLD